MTKLNNYGIRGVAYILIRSYLYNRQQFVSINQSQSNLKPVRVGVPQGLSLGPMFFLIYINDLHNSLESEPRLFADDTCLLVKGSNSEQLEINLNTKLHHLHLWCSVNKLTVNPAKTNIVIIPPKRIKTPIYLLNISSNKTLVNIVSCTKYVGVIIDNELNFHEQIKVMEGKVAHSLGILNKLNKLSSNCYVPTLLCISTSVTIAWYNYMGSHVSNLFTEIKIPTKSSDKSHCWCSFSRFNKPILLPIEITAN